MASAVPAWGLCWVITPRAAHPEGFLAIAEPAVLAWLIILTLYIALPPRSWFSPPSCPHSHPGGGGESDGERATGRPQGALSPSRDWSLALPGLTPDHDDTLAHAVGSTAKGPLGLAGAWRVLESPGGVGVRHGSDYLGGLDGQMSALVKLFSSINLSLDIGSPGVEALSRSRGTEC